MLSAGRYHLDEIGRAVPMFSRWSRLVAAALRSPIIVMIMFSPLLTERLIIRNAEIGDLDALFARRNDPAVAQYQSWTLPFPREEAKRMLIGAGEMAGPTDGEWWMASLVERSGGAVIGDVAVHVTWGGRAAELGYELATAYRGTGYAAEAVNAMVPYLFEDFGVSRITAMMHPDNLASVIVAERAGMSFEGRTKLSYWVGEGDAAENTDDLLYGLTRADWDIWRQRPTGPPSKVELIEITAANQRAVRSLVTHKSQERLVAPVAVSYGDALFAARTDDGPRPWLRAIEADGELAGFVMLALATERDPEPYLWRFLIDRHHQRRGIGGMALDRLEAMLRDQGHRSVRLSWMPGRGSPEPFYLGRGYEPTGEIVDGETEARKLL